MKKNFTNLQALVECLNFNYNDYRAAIVSNGMVYQDNATGAALAFWDHANKRGWVLV